MSNIGYVYVYLEKIEKQEQKLKELVKAAEESLKNSGKDSFKFAFLTNPYDAKIEFYRNVDQLEGWTKGRIFGSDAELRWRRVGNLLHVVFLTDGDEVPECFTCPVPNPLENLECDDSDKRYLWGSQRNPDGTWEEERIARTLRYPVKNSGKVPKLVICKYHDRGIVKFRRYKEVISE